MQHTMQSSTAPRKKHPVRALALTLALDVMLAGGIVGGDYILNYKLPHKLVSVNMTTQASSAAPQSGAASSSQSVPSSAEEQGGSTTSSTVNTWGQKFQEHFSDTVVSTDTVYKSPNISIELTQTSYDSGVIDQSDSGKHIKYGSMVSYTLADIYVSDITCLQTAFAQNTYGVGYSETLSSMSANMKSVLAVNGDSYSNNRHQNNGTIIRNGTVYRAQPSSEETCVLYRDGTMKTYTPDAFDAEQVIADGAWQTWVFGPSLLDESGNAKTDFLTWDYITQSHPRTAIGYYEPGHYCLLVVDGRNPGYSRGMFLDEMSQLFASLGCKAAYNLDGGHSSFMTKDAAVASHPYKPSKDISDGIFICEPEAQYENNLQSSGAPTPSVNNPGTVLSRVHCTGLV